MRRAIAIAGVALTMAMLCPIDPALAAGASGGGTQSWGRSYEVGTPATSFDVGVSPDGQTVFTTGQTGERPRHSVTMAYDASSGAQKWLDTYRSSSNDKQYDGAVRLAVSPDGSKVFITAQSSCGGCSGPGFNGVSTVAYDAATGDRLWVSRYAADGAAYSLEASPDGSKVFAQVQRAGGEASATIAYDASNGDTLWVIESTDAPVYWEGLAVSPDGSTVYIAGTSQTSDALCWSYAGGYHVGAYNASDGSLRWSSSYRVKGNFNCGIATSVAASPDGSKVFVTGYGGHESDSSAETVGLDSSNGDQMWSTRTNAVQGGGDGVTHLAVSPDSSKVFVTGRSCLFYPCPDQPFATAAYDSLSGTELWMSEYHSGGRNYANDIAVSSDGSEVLVTGQETMPCYSTCTVSSINAPLISYDPSTGDELWATSYPENSAFALAVNPNGSSVYLAGTFTSSTTTSSGSSSSLMVPRTATRLRGGSPTSCSGICGYSAAAFNTGFGPGVVQDSNPSIRYNEWKSFFTRTALGGAVRRSRTAGTSATYASPKTTKIEWVTQEGPRQGKARVLIDGQTKGVFDLYSPTTSSQAFVFDGLSLKHHQVKVEVLGRPNPSSKGTWVAIDAFKVKVGSGIVDEDSPNIRYNAWSGSYVTAASGGSYRASRSPSAQASMRFRGKRLALVTATGPRYGKAKVVIDGVAHKLDLYRPAPHWRSKVLFKGLGRGSHIVVFRPLGKRSPDSTSSAVVFDAFVVDPR
jgi:hypothetical protein